MWSPDFIIVSIAVIAAIPLANTCAEVPPSSAARFSSSRVRVGFDTRAYSYPLFLPISSCTYVEVAKIGTVTAPVEGSGSCPTWMARVAKPRLGFWFLLIEIQDIRHGNRAIGGSIPPNEATGRASEECSCLAPAIKDVFRKIALGGVR